MSDIISASDLVKRFRNVAVLDGLSLTVPEGSVFGLGRTQWRGENYHHQDFDEYSSAHFRPC
jgi:ABC-type sugar transport system ATPase subunit